MLQLRWFARIAAVVVSAMFLDLAMGELLSSPSHGPMRLVEWTGLFLVFLVILGMLAACKWELSGALLSLTALASFVVLEKMRRYGVVAVLALPGLLFLADAAISLKRRDLTR